MTESTTYASAGVDIRAASNTKDRIRRIVVATFGPEVLTDLGGFGGLFAPDWGAYKEPVLVSSADGVGTKLKIAFLTGIHDTVGADLVAHCANDILVQGAKPLFFLDYLAMGKHEEEVAVAIVEGVARGCSQVGCALLGGEMAEMPEFYQESEYDLAGTIVGVVEKSSILDGSAVKEGDVLIGIASSGLHTNGFSLARKLLFETAGWGVDHRVEDLGRTVGEELLMPHRPYVKPVFALLQKTEVRGIAHITGGGLLDNIPRSLPEGLGARIEKGSWPVPAIFQLLKSLGDVVDPEMYRTFNMGIGLVLIVSETETDRALQELRRLGESVFRIGSVCKDEGQAVRIE